MPAAVLLVHSSGPQGPGREARHSRPACGKSSGPAFEVQFPIMPAPEDPHFEPWSERLGEILAGIDEPVVVVGHSLGGSVALKHLSEADRREPIAGLLLVATPFWGERGLGGRVGPAEGWPDARTALPPTFLFHSRDDEEIPVRPARALCPAPSGAPGFIPLDGNGHLFDRGDLTEIIETIRSLSAA